MDQTMIQISNDIEEGDYLTFIGKEINVKYISKATNISPYEILTSFSSRLTRKYYIDGELVNINK